jgi:hypothetical protein
VEVEGITPTFVPSLYPSGIGDIWHCPLPWSYVIAIRNERTASTKFAVIRVLIILPDKDACSYKYEGPRYVNKFAKFMRVYLSQFMLIWLKYDAGIMKGGVAACLNLYLWYLSIPSQNE